MRIDSGTGESYSAKVDSENKLHTRTVSSTELQAEVRKGHAYNINTGEITLTNDTSTPVLYLKNNELNDLFVSGIIVGLNHSTGGSATDLCTVTVTRNPTGGTIVSNATAVDINSNRNYGSQNTLTADVYKGATGNTMTGDTDHIIAYNGDGGRLFLSIEEVLPKGSSIGIEVKAPSGNTSMACYAAIVCHLEEDF